MKICLVLPDLRGGGAERVCLDLGHAFQAMGHDVEIAVMRRGGEFLAEAQAAFPVVDLKAPRVRHLLPRLVDMIRKRRPDVILAAMWPLTVLVPLARWMSGHRCRVVVTEHGILSAHYAARGRLHTLAMRATMALGYRLADVRVGVSAGVVSDMAALSGMRRDRFACVLNPVRRLPQPDAAETAQVDALWATEGPRLLSVGSLKPVKNHALLLQAFALLPQPGARLMIVGQGQNEAKLKERARQLGLEGRVIFAGFHADPAPFYATADVFVLSSDHEGFGNVIVEALSFGLPVVSTDCPSGPAEILGRGRWGQLVPVGDAPALAHAMAAALSVPVDRAALQARAAAFAPDIAARRYLDLMEAP